MANGTRALAQPQARVAGSRRTAVVARAPAAAVGCRWHAAGSRRPDVFGVVRRMAARAWFAAGVGAVLG